MKLSKAEKIAHKYLELFKPHCKRIEIAGSIRRGKADVGDIELVCIPKSTMVNNGFFDEFEQRDNEFVKLVHSIPRVKGDGLGKYIQFILPEEIHLDMFVATERNFGNIFLIRTGDAEFSKKFIGKLLPSRGYFSRGGVIINDGGIEIDTPEESCLFQLAHINFIEPGKRTLNAI